MSEEQRTGWRRLRSRAGVHQGRPLSCFLAALGLVKCLLAAQRAMDNFHAMERYPEGVSDADKAKARELAEKMGAVTSYLDDATFVSSVSALCIAYRAYCEMASRRGWKCVETKSVLAHGFGGGQPHIDHSCLAKENEGKQRGHPGLQPRKDELNDTRGRGSCDTNVLSLKPSKYVELAPGVFALRPDAGLVNLGVPVGTDAYVTATVEESVRKHDTRLRKLVELALHATDATKSCGRNLGRMSARLGLRYSALARNVHFLRSVPERLGKSGAAMHDRGVMSAFAAAYRQAELREGVLCCEMTDEMLHPWFVEVRDRIALSTYDGGYDIRRWSKFQSAAFVGMVSLSWSSAKETIGEVTHCAYPALKDIIELATTIDDGGQRDGVWEDVSGAIKAANDLVHAWQESKEHTAQAYPKSTKEAAVINGRQWPGQWLQDTGGRLSELDLMPSQAQRVISKSTKKLVIVEVGEAFKVAAQAGGVGAARRQRDFEEFQVEHGGDWLVAAPWMEDGELHMGSVEEMYNYVLRMGGTLPAPLIPTGFEPEHDDTTEGKLGHVESLMNHLDTLVRGGADNVAVKREHTETHNRIQLLWYAMARSCGCGNVKMEDVAFDRGPAGREGGHHRPDLTFVLESLIHETWAYVGDVGLKWARARDKHTAATAGKMEAAEVTKDKSKNYSSGLKRVNKLRKENQLPEVQLRILAFAANSGAWGEDTERLWSEMCEAAKGMSESADLWGWSAMSWAKHWQQRIGVTLARGRAAVLLAALRRGDSENVMIDENVARREVETMEWSADVGAGSQATAAAEMQRWA